MNEWWHGFLAWLTQYQSNVVWSGLVLLIYLAMSRKLLPKLETNIVKSKLKSNSAIKGLFAARVIVATVSLALLLLAWGIDFSGLLVLSTSIITVTGVALFASWSLISNITAYFILLTNVAYRRGNYVRILDGDNFIEGVIADVGPFSTRLLTAERETLMYPNNLILTRPVLLNPKEKWGAMGKVVAKSSVETQVVKIEESKPHDELL
ncbi:MAG TPA: mechanosensitive ion channel protein MscS [Alteromonas macleodii]|uniref:mechanosensitive ion channel family protein n=1 Tax=Alteromonas TaxID=226 RepID=UPI000D773376|nr:MULTISPECIES: mechanosensitive ion channel family protein [Alteromonas]MEC7633455.1 mechanosensitive ion channel family protein [Pseudomonadota bacterium]RZP36161.1 MAG: mechanosensitive ion channel family protein [Alteromonas sp.]MEC9170857.1 mechanosensitive ion channel family protein [Pseudomonadota bacterium]MED5236484.1 mechanosensitive ion channel family protein [Pseudomonadota bacterium]MEE3306156.1 mechanosensitive ion channel family protein [Pseudomonadota bacterium]|tara:strand:+ start:242 stop:865 length:624 start_codon:yes stop_codon:yes gene_type:complete